MYFCKVHSFLFFRAAEELTKAEVPHVLATVDATQEQELENSYTSIVYSFHVDLVKMKYLYMCKKLHNPNFKLFPGSTSEDIQL